MEALVRETVLKNDVEGPIRAIGGLGANSYFKNSVYQRRAANVTKDIIDEVITKKLDVKSLSSASNRTICLADFGCAVGPNTFTSLQSLIDIVKKKYLSQFPNEPMPEFQVFFNDQPSNDFNTLFRSLPPDREYFSSGVPGSFHGRVFPKSSLHVVQSNYALHWLSKVPESLVDKNSPAWNKGKIHYAGASDEVLKAYRERWAEDLNNFLNTRAEEIVPGGMLIVIMPSIPDGMPYSELANGILYSSFESTLLDMSKRGIISEDQVDAFNLPIYAAPPGEFAAVVEKNGCFDIEAIGLTNPAPWLTDDVHVDMKEYVRHIRAPMEGMFTKHFPNEIVDEMFEQLLVNKLPKVFDKMERAYKDKIQSYYVLQRK
ncbi:loganic acid O-methyltransferase [Hevea brasiliensis]|uniref:loganic acid O-methyltransferase n=1 Tax=Hevea brasiliensis TaxID=3981 RepID=UPI0025F8923F|nr:loganic acid O-methyltransferase [Hevea brasiliensis]